MNKALLAVALVAVLLGASTAYFYSQEQALQGRVSSESTANQSIAGALQGRISVLEANLTLAEAQRSSLEAQLSAARGNATALDARVSSLDAQIASLNSELSSDQTVLDSLTAKVGLFQAYGNLSETQVIENETLSFSGSPAVLYYGPWQTANFAGYLNVTMSGPTAQGLQSQVRVTWSGYGASFDQTQTITGAGSAIFPVLLTSDLSLQVAESGAGSLTMTVEWVS